MKNLTIVIFLLLFLTNCSQKPTIKWISSTENSMWQESTIEAEIKTNSNDVITIEKDVTFQNIDGFGACFNELGWEALSVISTDEKNKILQDFFNPESGCKFNICRMPIGANDYAVDWYSHNETPDDFEMANFSIDRDYQRLIPYIKAAQKIRPDLQIWASPWCPPSWMKTNNHYACKPDAVNDLTPEGEGAEMVTQFKMNAKYLNAYALYFEKFIKAYSNEGIDIYAVHVQNEPNSCQNFPSCVWRPKDLAMFIKYLGTHFENKNLNTEIWLGTVERPQIERIDSILESPAGKYITGVGFQWAGKGAIPIVNNKYPNVKLMQTESECGNGSNDWDAAEHTYDLLKHYLNNGANTYLYWNMVLNETGKSQWGWKQNSLISIDSKSKRIVYNPEYYLMKHFSAFIESGAKKIKSSDKNILAFKKNNQVIIVTYNKGGVKKQTFKIDDKSFTASLKANSINTFIIE